MKAKKTYRLLVYYDADEITCTASSLREARKKLRIRAMKKRKRITDFWVDEQ